MTAIPRNVLFLCTGNSARSGRPSAAHWGLEDPAKVAGPGQREAFERTFRLLAEHVAQMLAQPND